MREVQEDHAMQLLLLMQKISNSATTTLREGQANQHQSLLQTGQTHLSHTHWWVKALNRKLQPDTFFSRLPETCFLFIINHPAADSCS